MLPVPSAMAFAASAPPLGWPASKARLCGVCAQGSMHQARQTRGMIHHKGKMAASCRTYRQARGSFMCITNTPDLPVSNVGVDGGDVWTGQRVSNEELELIVDEACSMSVRAPVIAQYYPGRGWLWHQWHRTIVRRTLPREVLGNIIFAFAVCMMFQGLGPTPWGSFFDHKIEDVHRAYAQLTEALFIATGQLNQVRIHGLLPDEQDETLRTLELRTSFRTDENALGASRAQDLVRMEASSLKDSSSAKAKSGSFLDFARKPFQAKTEQGSANSDT